MNRFFFILDVRIEKKAYNGVTVIVREIAFLM